MDNQSPKTEYKPNLYPIIYWALVYGIIAAIVLFAVNLLAGFIALIWFPVFLAGVIWGGYRKYQQDKAAWAQNNGTHTAPKSSVEEFKDAARDIAQASREMITRQAAEDKAVEQAVQEEILTQENTAEDSANQSVPEPAQEEKPVPPQSPLQPLV